MAELQRRHVVRVMVAYAAVAFVVLQLAEITFPAFSVQQGALRILVIVAALGLPVVLVLAWVFDITPQGIRRTEDLSTETDAVDSLLPRMSLLAVTLVTAGAVGWWAVVTNGVVPPASAGGGLGPTVQPVSFDPSAPITSLAVLPFDDFSAESQAYFAAGMHEALVAKLSQLPSVRVVSRTSVMRYAGQNVMSAPEIAAELGVDGLIEGSVILDGGRVRITVQLIHGPSDTHVWTESYEEDFSDILSLQATVAEAIAQAIQAQLSPADQVTMAQLTYGSRVDAAQESFMRGRYAQSQGTVEGYQEAVGHFQEAVRLDPEFAAAHASLAGAELMRGLAAPDVHEVDLPEARQHAARALELNENLPEAHEVLAMIDGELARSVSELRASGVQILAPDDAPPVVAVVVADSVPTTALRGGTGPPPPVREVEEGEERQITSLLFTPDSAAWIVGVTEIGQQLRRAWASFSETQVRAGMNRNPKWLIQTARQLSLAGHGDAAEAMLEEFHRSSPEDAQAWDELERLYSLSGRFDRIVELRWDKAEAGHGDEAEAEAIEEALSELGVLGYWTVRLQELERMDESGEDVSQVQIARAYAALGDHRSAMEHLEEAFRERDVNLIALGRDPVWDSLRQDPRFRRLVTRLRSSSRGRLRRPSGR